MVEPVPQAHGDQFGLGPGSRIGHPGQFHRGHHVFQRGHGWQQVERLQHDPDPASPGCGKGIFIKPGKVCARNIKGAAAGPFKAR